MESVNGLFLRPEGRSYSEVILKGAGEKMLFARLGRQSFNSSAYSPVSSAKYISDT